MPEAPNGWWLEVISSQRNKDNFLEVETWSWLTKKSRDNGDEPYIMHKAYMQVRETYQRIVEGPNKGLMWQPDKAQPPVEITDFAEFERTGQAIKYKAETVASKTEWEAQDGRKIAPFVFPTYYGLDEPLDGQYLHETFFLSEAEQLLAHEYDFLARAEANKWSGDWRHSTLNLIVGATADDSRVGPFTAWNNTGNLLYGDNGFGDLCSSQMRFTGLTAANAGTINSAILTVRAAASDGFTGCNIRLGFEAADNPAAVSNSADFLTRVANLTATTITMADVESYSSSSDYVMSDIKGSLQNATDRAGAGDAVNLFIKDNTSSGAIRKAIDYTASASFCGRLAVDYTAGGGGGPTVKTLAALGVG